MKLQKIFILFTLFLALCTSNLYSMERVGRLGLGVSNQLQNGMPALSFKLQKSKKLSFGGLLALDTDDNGGYGAGFKVFRNIFDEPQLNFYSAAMGAFTNQKIKGAADKSGFQFDMTMGSEFSFTGLNSLGFSFEFGVSFYKIDDFAIATTGHSFITAGIHFYL